MENLAHALKSAHRFLDRVFAIPVCAQRIPLGLAKVFPCGFKLIESRLDAIHSIGQILGERRFQLALAVQAPSHIVLGEDVIHFFAVRGEAKSCHINGARSALIGRFDGFQLLSYCVVLAVLVALFGLTLAIGGIWLITLGGSWYYGLAGIALLVTAVLLWRQRTGALGLTAAIWLVSLVWALWEVGLNGWGLVPRLVAISVVLILVALVSPALGNRSGAVAASRKSLLPKRAAAFVAAAVAIFALGAVFTQTRHVEIDGVAPSAGGDALAALPANPADWSHYGGDENAQRYSPLKQITPENVGKLERAFVFHTKDLPTNGARYSPEGTPLKVGNDLIMCSAKNILISVGAAKGTENWRYDPQVPNGAIAHASACRGVALYTAPALADNAQCKTRVVEATVDARLIAVDAKNGTPCADFGQNGAVDLWQRLGNKVPGWYSVTAPPTIVRGVVVTGAQVRDGQDEDAPSGVIRGYDAVTGALKWAWDLGNPENIHGPAEGRTYTRGTPNMWTAGVADEKLGYVY